MPTGEAQKLFGTDGIRGVAGEFPLDDATVEMIGRSIAVILSESLGHSPQIIIGRDTRESGPQIERLLARGIFAAGAKLKSAGIITTPGIAFITRSERFDAGIVISASHNPYRDNGIKVFTPTGEKLADQIERKIEAFLAEHLDTSNKQGITDAATLAPQEDLENCQNEYCGMYLDYLADEIGRGLDLSGLRLGLDCANGAASAIAPPLFERLGAVVSAIAVSPDGRNINEGCGSTHLELLQNFVLENGLQMGIAFDGDADRALFIDSSGKVIDGDQMLLILARNLQSRGLLSGNLVVATVMSNIGLEIALRENEIEMIRAQVGDRNVLDDLLRRGGKLGGEQSGHIIFPDISLAGDGLITGIEVLRAVVESGRRLDDLAAEMKRFPQVLINVPVRSKPPIESLPKVSNEISQFEEEMQGRGRLLVRYSGTENLARVMIEGEDQTTIEEQANRLASTIKQAIG